MQYLASFLAPMGSDVIRLLVNKSWRSKRTASETSTSVAALAANGVSLEPTPENSQTLASLATGAVNVASKRQDGKRVVSV